VTLTLLIDLDGTLLVNEMGAFLSSYFRSLGKHVEKLVDPDRMLKTLMMATQRMMANQRPDKTLKETFDEIFFPTLGMKESELRGTFEAFYRDIFPHLREFTRPNPDTAMFIEEAFRRGIRVGIATNPLFPKTAITQRISWAGIDPEADQLELISSYENFHFAKPHLSYYAEFMAQLGWPEGRVVMIGNDPEMDIIPAHNLGLPTFYIPEYDDQNQSASFEHSPIGSLAGLLEWIDSQPAEQLTPNFSSPEALLAILRSTPAALHTLTRQLPQEAWTYCPIPGEWCMAEVICHLRDVDAEVNLPRMDKMLKEDNPFIPGMDTDAWVSERHYIAQDCTDALTSFTKNRMELLELLENIMATEWERPARHAILGPTQLLEMVSIIASHDRLHVQQIFKSIPE
jgi:FMN phosphatase YigB (HAD superfamily)